MDIKNWIGCGGDKAEAAYRMGLAQSCQSWTKIDSTAASEGAAERAMWINVALLADGSGKSCSVLFGRTTSRE